MTNRGNSPGGLLRVSNFKGFQLQTPHITGGLTVITQLLITLQIMVRLKSMLGEVMNRII